MKAEELMIGDWVRWKDRFVQIATVSGIVYSFGHVDVTLAHCNDDKLLESHDIKSISPIPLTTEIIEKNGMKPFDIDKLTEKATAKWWHKSGDFFIKQYHFKHNNFKPSYSFGCNNHTLIEGIEYVHELQHSLRLCKIDKKIVL